MKVKEKMIEGVAMTQNLTYTRCGDYLIPDIRLSYVSDKPLGKYGRMRRVFLAENNPKNKPIAIDTIVVTIDKRSVFSNVEKIFIQFSKGTLVIAKNCPTNFCTKSRRT